MRTCIPKGSQDRLSIIPPIFQVDRYSKYDEDQMTHRSPFGESYGYKMMGNEEMDNVRRGKMEK